MSICLKHGTEKVWQSSGKGKKSLRCQRCNTEKVREHDHADRRRPMISHAKRRAKNKGVPFAVTKDDFTIPEYCPVLGIKLEYGTGSGGFIDASPTLDRKRPELGYIRGNVEVVSWRANRIKCDGTLEEILKIASWMQKSMDAT